MPAQSRRRRICFVTGTRAEFGLMIRSLQAILADSRLMLQIVATGMHLDRRHGRSLDQIRAAGFKVDATVPWPADGGKTPAADAQNVGLALARLVGVYRKLRPDIVLVVGDRVEAFAGAAAAHLCRIPLAHIHGGDRAIGQVDDSLRHAITKLAHIHLPATEQSARRIAKMGEDSWRIFPVGSPGLDDIRQTAADWQAVRDAISPDLQPLRYAVVLLHPVSADEREEYRRARLVLRAVASVPFEHIVLLYPNNDPGANGILRCWQAARAGTANRRPRITLHTDLSRALFLGLLRDAVALVGNSSSGIIEAASFGTFAVDIGPRQKGRQRSANTIWCDYDRGRIERVLQALWKDGRPHKSRAANVYGGHGVGSRIADILATIPIDDRLLTKLIAY